MGFALDRGQGRLMDEAVLGALRGQLDEAAAVLREAGGPGTPIFDTAVHEARKSLKRARAVLRLLQPGLGKKAVRSEAKALAATARRLAAARDARILHDTLERLAATAEEGPERAAVQAAQAARQGQGVPHVPDEARDTVLSELGAACERVQGLALAGSVQRTVHRGLARLLRQIRSAYATASSSPSAENFHALRKRCKDFFYVCKLLTDASPNLVGPLVKDLDRLGEALGEEHDLALLAEQIHARPEEWGGSDGAAELVRLTGRERERLQGEARPLCERLIVLSPGRFGAGVARELKETWRSDAEQARANAS
ncbi:MAG: CHAD domain-containing protein [Polyangia bacterium]